MDSLKIFVTLLALVNPLGVIPVFIGLTMHQSAAERERTLRITSMSVALVIIVGGLLGKQIIGFFGISIASFQVGGGILLLLMAVGMMNAKDESGRATPEETTEGAIRAETKGNIAVVPLTIPLLTGPGTISTVIIYADRASRWYEYLSLVGSGLALGAVTWVAFRMADPISRAVGRTGINIVTRLMGLILAALAVELIADGLLTLLPGLRGA